MIIENNREKKLLKHFLFIQIYANQMVKSIEIYICIILVFKFTNYQAAGRQCDIKKKKNQEIKHFDQN